MANEQHEAVKDLVASLPKPEQRVVQACYDELLATILRYGDAGTLALALLGSELSGDD